jgi:Leucine-rich repeat (LRR) protein
MKLLGFISFLIITLCNGVALSQQKTLTIFRGSKLTELEKELQNKDDTVKCLQFHFFSDDISKLLMKYEKENIELIIISTPSLNKIPDFIFSYKNLKSLLIMESRISEVPSTIVNLKKLEEISISSNQDVDITNLKYLDNLKNVSMSICKLTKFPNTLLELKKLENLDFVFKKNSINLDDWFTNLDKIITLNTLTLSDLKYIEISKDSIFKNSHLQELVMYRCNSASIYKILKLDVFSNIISLSLINCGLKKLPEIISDFKSLETLDFSKNKINKIQNSILLNCKIKKIVAIDTKIKDTKMRVCEHQEFILKSIPFESRPHWL